MHIEKISFSASNIGVKTHKTKTTESEYKNENTQKNNKSKYIIGTAVGIAALTGMVIAGRKGYLGEKVQNILGKGIKKSKEIQNKVNIAQQNEPVPVKQPVETKEIIKNTHQKTKDIIKDGKKIGVEIQEYKNDNLICTITKTFDDNQNINIINEKYTNGRNIEIKRIKVNHNDKDYTVWKYFEMPEKGSSKSMNFKLDENNDYTFDLICVYPNEIEAIKQKLTDNGIKLGKCLTNL